MSDNVVGFIPWHRCPNCGEMHQEKYAYKGTPIIVCEKLPNGQLIFLYPEKEILSEDGTPIHPKANRS